MKDEDSPITLDFKQSIVVDEDLDVTFYGRKINQLYLLLYNGCCVLSLGSLYIFCRWFPKIKAFLTTDRCLLKDSSLFLIKVWLENSFNQFSIYPLINEQGCKYVEYNYIRFIMQSGLFKISSDLFEIPNNHQELYFGNAPSDVKMKQLLFGKNSLSIKEKTNAQIFMDEVLHPFNVFQIYSIILWCFDEYYLYALCIFTLSCISTVNAFIETKKNIKSLKELSNVSCKVSIFRGSWLVADIEDLLPGDLFELIPELGIIPCDSILLSGDLIIDESMLTGESVPISKSPILECEYDSLRIPPKSILSSGTKLVRIKKEDNRPCLAYCTGIGFSTSKGVLIRSILFPKPHHFKFYRDSFIFVGMLSIMACCGFFISLYFFIAKGAKSSLIIKRAFDLFTIVVPPALPATMSIGTTFALLRLRKNDIFCIRPSSINIGGKLNVFVFDKTGTLTEDGLTVLGIQTAVDSKFQSIAMSCEDWRLQNKEFHDGSLHMLHLMATCHNIRSVNNVLIGDPLELKMFEFTDWNLEECDNSLVPIIVKPKGQASIDDAIGGGSVDIKSKIEQSNYLELGIIRSFDFNSNLRRMSVLSKRFGNSNIHIYVKGAPESIKGLCKSSSIPSDFNEILMAYARKGYRVLGCAGKLETKLTWLQAQKINREAVERDLVFLGFIIFENKIKAQTSGVIEKLKAAKFRNIMCTGDNLLTAISVSKDCGLIPQDKPLFSPRICYHSSSMSTASTNNLGDESSDEDNSYLKWRCLDKPELTLNEVTLRSCKYEYEYFLVCSGEEYDYISENCSSDLFNKFLVKCQVFARMSPEQKNHLVDKLQQLGYCVAFCGDGANDCGALKAADVGISLSNAEASVAASFTSKVTDISCCLNVVKEGRAALVTSFSCFKYMALYSIIQFCSVTLLYIFMCSLSDPQFLYIDLFLIFPMAFMMGKLDSIDELAAKRPTANILSRKVLISLIGSITIQTACQIGIFAYTITSDWFVLPEYDPSETNTFNHLNTVLFLVSIYQYVFVGIIFVVGKPFQQPFYKNVPLVFLALILLLFNSILLFSPSVFSLDMFFKLHELPFSIRLYIGYLSLAAALISWVFENYLVIFLSNFIKKLKRKSKNFEHRKLHKKISHGFTEKGTV